MPISVRRALPAGNVCGSAASLATSARFSVSPFASTRIDDPLQECSQRAPPLCTAASIISTLSVWWNLVADSRLVLVGKNGAAIGPTTFASTWSRTAGRSTWRRPSTRPISRKMASACSCSRAVITIELKSCHGSTLRPSAGTASRCSRRPRLVTSGSRAAAGAGSGLNGCPRRARSWRRSGH